MRLKTVVFGQIALLSVLTAVLFTAAWAEETTLPREKLASIFPTAANFVEKQAELTPDQVASIEEEIGTKLRPTDLKPTFHIAFNASKTAVGLALFVDVEGPSGVISGAVGLDITGKVVKVRVHTHNEVSGIAEPKFLDQFIGKGIEDAFEVGKDVEPIAGEQAASQAVALMPKKTLAFSYALFLKRPETPEEDAPETYEPEDLKEVMMMMKDEYDLIRAYFQKGAESKDIDKEKAVKAAEQLGKHAELIADFEPPKNPNNTDEYAYLQKQFHDAIQEFAQTLKAEGISEKTQKQWQEIIHLADKAHLRFSVEEIDLDEDLN